MYHVMGACTFRKWPLVGFQIDEEAKSRVIEKNTGYRQKSGRNQKAEVGRQKRISVIERNRFIERSRVVPVH